jgi:hypothetical protein
MNDALLKSIRTIGLVLFIVAISIFTLSLFLGEYKLTSETFEKSVTSEAHRAALAPELAPMMNKTYGSSWSFVADYRAALERVNEKLRAKQKWSEVIYTDYAFVLTKNAAIGVLREHQGMMFFLSIVLGVIGALLHILPQARRPMVLVWISLLRCGVGDGRENVRQISAQQLPKIAHGIGDVFSNGICVSHS